MKPSGTTRERQSPRCPLHHAHEVSEGAARRGFDWPDIVPVIAKVREELGELEAALAERDPAAVAAELGDCFFALVNVARFVEVLPGEALAGATARFETRFRHVVRRLAEDGLRPEEASLEQMERLWEEAKRLAASSSRRE